MEQNIFELDTLSEVVSDAKRRYPDLNLLTQLTEYINLLMVVFRSVKCEKSRVNFANKLYLATMMREAMLFNRRLN